MQLILASGSPRRRQILKEMGMEFEVQVPGTEEGFDPSWSPEEGAVENAVKKAQEIARGVQDAIVIGADTIVVLGDTIFTKPKDAEDAVRMLQTLAGKRHRVITGLAFIVVKDGRIMEEVRDHMVTWVTIKQLSAEEIRSYVKECAPMDKAGAYAVQEIENLFVEQVEGDFSNVVGFPRGLVRQRVDALFQKYA